MIKGFRTLFSRQTSQLKLAQTLFGGVKPFYFSAVEQRQNYNKKPKFYKKKKFDHEETTQREEPVKEVSATVEEISQKIADIETTALTETSDSPSQQRTLTKKLIKELPNYTHSTLVALTQNICKSNYLIKNDYLWQKLESEYKKRMKHMELSEIAEVLWCFAYANRHDPKFFQEIENAIFECDLDEGLDYRLIGKILWGFSHANHGSTILYKSLANKIHKIYFEINPIKIAEYAYYFSKASNSMQGGFGTYQLAEKVISERLKDFDLKQLARICEYLLPQNIGSNKFYLELENQIKDVYPDQIEPSTLVSLVKSMSKFRFQTDLFSRLQRNIMEYMEYLSNSQLEDVLWSFTRGRRGSNEFYEKIDQEFIKRMNTLKPRGVAFSFYGFSLMNKGTQELIQKYQEYIEKNIDKFNVHYLAKILIGLRRRNYDPFCEQIMKAIVSRLPNVESPFRVKDVIRILESISGYLPLKKEMDIGFLYDKIEELVPFKAREDIPNQKILEFTQIFYHFILNNQGSPQFIEKLLDQIEDINAIPKNLFAKAFFGFVEIGELDKAEDFLPIVDELCKYGEIKYFFDHEDFIRLIWSISTLINNDTTITKELPNLARQNIKETMFELNPNTLTADGNKLYYQLWPLMRSFVEFSEEDETRLYEKLAEINQHQKEELIDSDPHIYTNPAVREEVLESCRNFFQSKGNQFEIVKGMTDEFYQYLDVGIVEPQTLEKIGIMIFNKKHYLKCREEPTPTQYIKNKIDNLSGFGWRVITLNEEEWMNTDSKQNREKLNKLLSDELAAMRPSIDSNEKN